MTWNFHAEEVCAPRERAKAIHLQIDELAEAEIVKQANSFRGTTVEEAKDQILAAADFAKRMVTAHKTDFPTGCKVCVDCDGHIGNEELNVGPRSCGVRIFVNPVPFHR